MRDQGNRRLHARSVLLGLLVAGVALAGCGSSSGSGDAAKLLQQTFGQSHKVNSGQLSVSLSVQPSASSTLKSPLSLSLGGPFQSLGAGKLPQSDFSLSISLLGRSVSFGILSTGTAGYVSFQGTSYPLPAAEFQKLESSFASLASSPGGGQSTGILGKLGIHPLSWLRNPTVVGDETVQGAPTTHVHAGINVALLLHDFNTFLGRAGSLGITGAAGFPRGLGQTTIDRLSTEIQNPSFDVWTGKTDKTIRKLMISLNGPVPTALSALLGSRAGLALSMQYSNLNQPQTITAPTNVAPYSQFASKVRSFVGALLGGSVPGLAGSASSGGGTSTTGGGSSTTGGSSSSKLNNYAQCIQSAGSDVAKMQQCASLLNGK